MGGGFFHSLLAPMLALPLGGLGGLVAKGLLLVGRIYVADVVMFQALAP